jgi:hypothetical protein
MGTLNDIDNIVSAEMANFDAELAQLLGTEALVSA